MVGRKQGTGNWAGTKYHLQIHTSCSYEIPYSKVSRTFQNRSRTTTSWEPTPHHKSLWGIFTIWKPWQNPNLECKKDKSFQTQRQMGNSACLCLYTQSNLRKLWCQPILISDSKRLLPNPKGLLCLTLSPSAFVCVPNWKRLLLCVWHTP